MAMPLSHTELHAGSPLQGTCKEGREELDMGSDHRMPFQSSSQHGSSGTGNTWCVSLSLGRQSRVGLWAQAVAVSSGPEWVTLTPQGALPGLADFRARCYRR